MIVLNQLLIFLLKYTKNKHKSKNPDEWHTHTTTVFTGYLSKGNYNDPKAPFRSSLFYYDTYRKTCVSKAVVCVVVGFRVSLTLLVYGKKTEQAIIDTIALQGPTEMSLLPKIQPE